MALETNAPPWIHRLSEAVCGGTRSEITGEVKPLLEVLAVGDAGALIPRYEYPVLRNALADRTSITLHVYGGEMDPCNCFSPRYDGWWQRESQRLAYDN